jgi:hypothetical protein
MSDAEFCESKIFIADGQVIENIQYRKKDTPCEHIAEINPSLHCLLATNALDHLYSK